MVPEVSGQVFSQLNEAMAMEQKIKSRMEED